MHHVQRKWQRTFGIYRVIFMSWITRQYIFCLTDIAVARLKLYFLLKMQCCWACLIGRWRTVLIIVILDTKIAVLARQWLTPSAALLQLRHRASHQNAKWAQVMNTPLCTSGKCHFTSMMLPKYTHKKMSRSPLSDSFTFTNNLPYIMVFSPRCGHIIRFGRLEKWL